MSCLCALAQALNTAVDEMYYVDNVELGNVRSEPSLYNTLVVGSPAVAHMSEINAAQADGLRPCRSPWLVRLSRCPSMTRLRS